MLALVLLGLAVVLSAHLAGATPPRRPLQLPVVALGLLFALAESGRLNIEVRDSAHAVSLTDVVVVVALFTVSPLHAVLLRLAGGIAVALWLYRRSLTRIAVNLGIMAAETALAGTVLTSLARLDPTSPHSWAGAVFAVVVSGLLSALSVVAAIAISGEKRTLREVLAGLSLGVTVSAVAGVLGVICAMAAITKDGGWLLLVVAAIMFAVYRGYGRLLERKAALDSVYGFGRTLDESDDTEALFRVVLSQVPKLVNATRAEAFLLGATGLTRRRLVDEVMTRDAVCQSDWPLREVIESRQPRLLSRHSSRRSVRQILRDNSVRQAMIAPLLGPAGVAGVLVVTDRMGYVRAFRRSDLLLFETLARHAGAALAKVSLVQELRRDVEYDRLTGLLNRQGTANALDGMQGTSAGVVLLQVSGITEVSDALGHEAGARLLQAAARRVRASVHETTAVGRLDGDVFAVMLRGCEVDEATSMAERLIDVVMEPVELDEVPLALGATASIACGDGSSLLIRQAEIALRATQRGGGLVGVYDRAMEPPSVRRLSIAAELRRVLADPELAQQVVPFYQPKADLKTGCVHGVEALVRWQHPQRGLIPPGDFIPVVESTDLVRPLTLRVLDRALSDGARWTDAGMPLTVAVNLCARSLYDPKLVRDVADLLAVHAVMPQLLTLEITEGTVMQDADRARHILEDLTSIGVTISVDDFGTGYSSLAYLARLPVSEVKVDRMFVSRMTSDSRDAAVVRSVIDLGHSLNLRVVAEGVEDEDCWDALTKAGADVAQGFLLSRPLEVRALEQWLGDRNIPGDGYPATLRAAG